MAQDEHDVTTSLPDGVEDAAGRGKETPDYRNHDPHAAQGGRAVAARAEVSDILGLSRVSMAHMITCCL